ncbi:ribose transport system substrate-binding protein [Bartonella sp. A1379B]|uniref:hypothetical protein n=1 Tax=Bartonella sp. A1379B TaxID=1933910 RepID=UPI0009C3BF41|nr:hypothetical protein [Bartonella sp. A1379B]AQX18106.1 ribose transport system substrate-binding protein [Bartonella sp. A1379B]
MTENFLQMYKDVYTIFAQNEEMALREECFLYRRGRHIIVIGFEVTDEEVAS